LHESLPQARPSQAGVQGWPARSSRYAESSPCSQEDRGPVGGIVFATSACVAMAFISRLISVSLS
jgi:hypothetical protein